MAASKRMKGAAGLIDMINGNDSRKTKPPYRYVRGHTMGAHILRLTGHRYGGYGPPSVPTPKPTLVLLFSKIICWALSMSPHRHQ